MADYDHGNIFAKILRGEIPSNKVYEDEFALAFHDVSPASAVHVLVVPKGAFVSFDDFMQTAGAEMISGYFKAVQTVAMELNLQESGYRLISNHGVDASQTVPHFHMHILGGQPLGGLLASDRLTR